MQAEEMGHFVKPPQHVGCGGSRTKSGSVGHGAAVPHPTPLRPVVRLHESSWLSLRQQQLGNRDREAIGTGVDSSAARASKKQSMRGVGACHTFHLTQLWCLSALCPPPVKIQTMLLAAQSQRADTYQEVP